jgi:endo-1,4-beta-xylanase
MKQRPSERNRSVSSALRAKNVPLHAVGLQGHYELDRAPFADIEAALVAMRELGVKVVVSELDDDVIPRSKWWAEGGKYRDELAKFNPYWTNGCPRKFCSARASNTANCFAFSETCGRCRADFVLGLHDGQSWLNNFPWTR